MGVHGGFPIRTRNNKRARLEAVDLGSSEGGIVPVTAAPSDHSVADAETSPVDGDMQGFRHLLLDDGPPPEGSRFTIDGKAPHTDDASTKRLRAVMNGLARHMEADFKWTPHPPNVCYPDLRCWENPEIPSGYTYLLQLVAHDVVSSSFPISLVEDTITGVRNTRSTALKLDTIYGGGPSVCPIAYRSDEKNSGSRTAMRMGRVAAGHGGDILGTRFRDIARAPAPEEGASRDQLTETCIADPRNDDHAIMAQMTALFHIVHNSILDLLPAPEKMIGARSLREAAFDRFLCARGAVTLIYRSIVRQDLLKKILHPEIYEYYVTRSGELLDPHADDPRIPLEFSHAVFRFGHAMARRKKYRLHNRGNSEFRISEALNQTSEKKPREMPLSTDWVIQWSRFFKINDTKPNLSQRIGPSFTPDFVADGLFPPIDEQNNVGLTYRDLLSGGFLNLWSVKGLIGAIESRLKDRFPKSQWLASGDWQRQLEIYFNSNPNPFLTPSDVKNLINDPPLVFFILFEAASEPEALGLRLGWLGSVVVAEVIMAALARDPITGDGAGCSLLDALAALSERIYGDNYLCMVPEIATMPELIKFVARINNLEKPEHGFV